MRLQIPEDRVLRVGLAIVAAGLLSSVALSARKGPVGVTAPPTLMLKDVGALPSSPTHQAPAPQAPTTYDATGTYQPVEIPADHSKDEVPPPPVGPAFVAPEKPELPAPQEVMPIVTVPLQKLQDGTVAPPAPTVALPPPTSVVLPGAVQPRAAVRPESNNAMARGFASAPAAIPSMAAPAETAAPPVKAAKHDDDFRNAFSTKGR